MRAAPAGLMYADPARPSKWGATSLPSRTDIPAGGCRQGSWRPSSHTCSTVRARRGRGADQAVSHARTRVTTRRFDAVDRAVAMAAKGMPTPEEMESLGGAWVGEEALAIGLCCALAGSDAPAAILASINHSGDSDSTGIVCGSLVGVIAGADPSPAVGPTRSMSPIVVTQIADDMWRERFDPPVSRRPTSEWLIRYPAADGVTPGAAAPSKPSMSFCVLFPGQGSQHVGMGADLFEARPDLLGETADEVLGWSLSNVCLEGPEEVLTSTDRAQPALFALSYALWDELAARLEGHAPGRCRRALARRVHRPRRRRRDRLPGCAVVGGGAGQSDGPGGGCRTVRDGCAARSRCGRRRTDRRDRSGRMAAGCGSPTSTPPAKWWWPAAPRTSRSLTERGRELGVRRVVPLKVAGAFHSPLMLAGGWSHCVRRWPRVDFGPARLPGVVQRHRPSHSHR